MVGLLTLGGCSRTCESTLLGVSYEPPKGFELFEEKPGAAPRAVFSGGLELVSVAASLPKVEEGSLAAISRRSQTALGEQLVEAQDARARDVNGSPVARHVIRGRQSRQRVCVRRAARRAVPRRAPRGERGRVPQA